MTVPIQTPTIQYIASGSTAGPFAFPFKIMVEDDLQVFLNGSQQTSGYTVTGIGADDGGDVTFNAILPNGTVVLIKRYIPLERVLFDYQTNGDLLADTVNSDFDRIWMALQDIGYYVGNGDPATARALLLGDGDVSGDGAYRALQNRIQDLGDALNPQDAVNLRTLQKAIANLLVDGAGDVVMALLANTTDPTLGDALVGVTQPFVGAVARTQHAVNSDRASVLDFGADPSGVTESTAAFYIAQFWAKTVGGARISVPYGTYMLKNFEVDQARVVFEGETGGFTYEKIPDPTKVGVRLIPAPDAIWTIRLKGTSTGAAAQGSGIRNMVINDTSSGAHEYGLVVDSAATIVEDVHIQDFQYNWAKVAAANNNVYRRVSTTGATKMGFLVSEHQAKAYMHPDIPDIPAIPSTLWKMTECVIRQNEFGAMIRDGIGASLGDTVIESNRQSGLYVYRTDQSTVRDISFDHIHFENNYDGYAGNPAGYNITGNRAFLIGDASTYLAWSNTLQVPFQLIIDSQTHGGTGGSDNLLFGRCAINCNSPYQRAILGLSGTKTEFDHLNIGGEGDEANLIRFTVDANATKFVDPIYKNDPTATVPCLVDNFGANMGSRGVYLKSGTNVGELGSFYPIVGSLGGPIHILKPVDGDPRNNDARMLDEYFETLFPGLWRTDGATPFNVLSETSYFTKIGRFVKVQCRVTVQVSTATTTQQTLYLAGGLPQGAENSGFLVGQILVSALSGATPVVNSGRTQATTNTASTIIGLDPVFPALTLGHQYLIMLDASYIAKT
jgi:hypothetical protein